MNGKIQGITIEIGGDTSPLMAALDSTNKKFREAQTELTQINKALKLDPHNIELVAQKQTVLQEQAAASREKLEQLNLILDELGKKQIAGENVAEQLRAVQREASTTGAKLKDTENTLASLDAQMGNTKQQTALLGDGFTQMSQQVNDLDDKLGGKLTKTVEAFGVAAVAGTGVAIKKFSDFSTEMVKVKTLLDQNIMSYDDAQDMVTTISRDTGIAAGEVANAAYQALSAGIKTEDLKGFLETAAKTSVSGFTDMETAVDVLTTTMNSYGIATDQVAIISDKLLTTQDKGKTTVGDLSQGMGQLVGIASNAGVSLDEVLGATAALTANGLPTSSAINSVKMAISGIIKPTGDATKMAEELGINFSAQALQANGLSGVLADVQQKTGGNTEQMAKLFGSVEALNAVMILTGKGAESFDGSMEALGDSAGKTDKSFQDITEESGIQLQIALNALSTSAISVGDALSPLINALAGFLTVLSAIDPQVIIIIGTMVLVATVILQIVKAVNTLSNSGGKIGTFFGGFNVSAMKTTAIVLAVVAALIALAAIIAVIIGRGSDLRQTMDTVSDSVGQVQDTVNNAGNKVPHYATGTQFHRGGPAIITEYAAEQLTLPNGAQMMMLPRGTRVDNNTMLGNQSNHGAVGDIFHIAVNVDHLNDIQEVVEISKRARLSQRQGFVRA